MSLGDTDAFVPTRVTGAAQPDGTFDVELPDPDGRQGPITATAFGPDGLPAGERVVPADVPADPVELPVTTHPGTSVPPSEDPALGQQLKYSGLALDPEGRGVPADLLLVLWGRQDAGDALAALSVTRTSAGGYFSGQWPARRLADANAVLSGGAAVPIPLEDGLLPRRIVLQVPEITAPPEKDEDCSCPDGPPRAPDQVDLTANAEAYAGDAGRCVDLTVPNRAVDEVAYHAVVRTTQPQLDGTRPTRTPVVPSVLIDRLVELAQVRPVVIGPAAPTPVGALPAGSTSAQTGPIVVDRGPLRPTPVLSGPDGAATRAAVAAPAAPASAADVIPAALVTAQRFVPGIDLDGRWASSPADALAQRVLEQRALTGEPLRLEPSVLADLSRETADLTPLRLVVAEQTSVVRRFRTAVTLADQGQPGRFTLDPGRQVQWDELPLPYQATTIAHGHLLTLRQVWRADGYSLGDLLYSLPLAPGQQKLVSVLDWDRSEVAARRAERTEAESLTADLSHDRDISDVISTSLSESMRGSSRADVESVGGGIAGFIGPLVFGAAGGVSSAGSTANQTSARSITGSALNHVRDRTLQSASSVRSQRSTVVQTSRQGESVRAQTEAVANYNHCHALTVEYFEVLRHLQVSQELAGVQECLFIPFSIAPFTTEKALRWREPLEPAVSRRDLAGAFDSLDRVRSNWVGADYPVGRYADEVLIDLDGELTVRITLPRPADGEDDEFVEGNWAGYVDLLWDTPENIWKRYLGVALEADRDAIWDARIAPGIAQRLLETLTAALVDAGGSTRTVDLDPAMVGLFAQDRALVVGIRAEIPLPVVQRAQIDRVRLALAASTLPSGARIVVDSGTLRYRTAHLSADLFANRRILNDLSIGDTVEIPVPLTPLEKRNPRELDRRQAEPVARPPRREHRALPPGDLVDDGPQSALPAARRLRRPGRRWPQCRLRGGQPGGRRRRQQPRHAGRAWPEARFDVRVRRVDAGRPAPPLRGGPAAADADQPADVGRVRRGSARQVQQLRGHRRHQVLALGGGADP